MQPRKRNGRPVSRQSGHCKIRKRYDEMNPTQVTNTLQEEIGQPGAFTSGELSKAIMALVKENDCTSFVELEKLCQQHGVEHRGDLAMMLGEPERNIIVWANMSPIFYGVVRELIERKAIFIWLSIPLVYAIDGKVLDLPVLRAKTPKKTYSRPMWLPIVFRCIPSRKHYA